MSLSHQRKSVTVTIGLPVFNAKRYVELALRSIFAQTFRDWELIVIDDGSSDGSPELLHGLDDERVRVIADGRHLGLGARLNQIVGLARGRYIARMDADDLMHPERLQIQVDYLLQHPQVDVVGCSLLLLDRNLSPAGLRCLPSTHAQICSRPLRGFLIAHATLLGRVEWFSLHPYDETLVGCEDWGLFLTSFQESTFANIPGPLYFYREAESYSVTKYIEAKRQAVNFLWRHARPRFGLAATVLTASAHYARAGIYGLAAAMGVDQYLLRARNRPVDAGALALGSVIEQVLATPLPRHGPDCGVHL
jgi:glycosyltransferase involved in cell wall biosynthesis